MNKRNTAIVTGGLMLGMLLAALDQTIAATALPTIVGELGGLAQMTWVTAAYLLASVAVVPIVGKLADLYGRRRWYLVGITLFMIGSALCGTSQTMTQLILFRGLQGLGGGMLMPIAQTIIGDLFPGPARAKLQGLLAAVFGFASILGPKLGGWIVDLWHWRWVFYINLPLGLIAAAVIAFGLKETLSTERRRVDYWGAFTVAAGASLLLLALMEGGRTYPWLSWPIIGMLGSAGALLTAFLLIESRVPEPVLPLDLFRNRVFAVANALIFLMSMGMFGAVVFIPFFMQGVVGTSASSAGSVLTPMMLGMVASSIIGSRLLLRVSYRTLLVVNASLTATGFYLMSTMGTGTTQLTAVAYMVIAGFGMGGVMPTVTIAVQTAFPSSQRGVVTSSVNFFRSIGSSLGVTLLGVVMNSRAAALVRTGLDTMAAQVPPQAAGALAPLQALAAKDPQQAFALLLRPDLMAQIPAPLQPALRQTLVGALSGSLHTVFLVSLGIAVAAAAVALLIGQARLGYQTEPTPPPALAD